MRNRRRRGVTVTDPESQEMTREDFEGRGVGGWGRTMDDPPKMGRDEKSIPRR